VSESRIRAVLFDMDGTLVDTLPDIAAAVNAALRDLKLRELDDAHIAGLIGNGPRVLSRRALEAQASLGAEQREALVEPLLAGYAGHYATQAGSNGRLYPGALDMLQELRAQGRKLGVVTNALQPLAETVLTRFRIRALFDVVVGGSSGNAQVKPHPQPLWSACEAVDVPPRDTLMVGDSINDVAAARAAGCACVCVPHGYDQGSSVHELGVDVVDGLAALPAWIEARERERWSGER
jgi:phosphoglycolate phosphatase